MPRARKGLTGFNLRIPTEVHQRLSAAASASGGSINAEICKRLERSFDYEDAADFLRQALRLPND